MTIWILAFLLFGFLAWMGYVEGAIRVAIMLLGLIFATWLALPLAPIIKPIFPLMGVTNPYLLWLLPLLTGFILVQLVFTGIAFAVHHKVSLYYKYKVDDLHRLRWEHLNKRLGFCVGLGAACVYLIVIGLLIGVFGYLTVQVSTAENTPLTLQYLNNARSDLNETGLDKLVAKVDPTPQAFYEAADIAGLIYHNPLLQSRLSGYPGLLSIEERPEFQELANDKDFIELFQRQENIMTVLNHPRVQVIAKNQEIMNELAHLDFKDLREYLQTGSSAKYEEEKILGRWQLDLNATLADLKKALPKLPVSAWKNVRKALTMSAMSFTASTDNKVFVKVQAKESILKLTQPAPPASAPAAAGTSASPRTPGPGFSPRSLAARADPNSADQRYQQRYGRRPGGAAEPPPPVLAAPVQAPPPPSPILKLIFSGEGTWRNEGDKYKISVKDDKEHLLAGTIRQDALILANGGLRLIFEKE